MVTRAQLVRTIHKMGATVEMEREGGGLTVMVDAPPTFIFRDNGIHVIIEWSNVEQAGDTAALYREVMKRVVMGLDPCEEVECDVCDPILQELEN